MQVPRPPPTQAVNQDDRLLNYLKRVRLIASGQTQDLQRCQRDVDSVSSVTNIANNFMFAACVVRGPAAASCSRVSVLSRLVCGADWSGWCSIGMRR